MPIKFACPHCKRTLSVKEELAGRRAACPGCKQPVTIPTISQASNGSTATVKAAPPKPSTAKPTSAPQQADIEALAAAALTDSKQGQAALSTIIDFTCPFCDMELHLTSELAGKQTPCPECRRIVKVPMLTKTGPRDWTKTDGPRTPGGAKIDTTGMDDAWGTRTNRGGASREALVEAGVIREDDTPPMRKWIIRGSMAAALLALVGGGLWAWVHFSARNIEQDGVKLAENWLKKPENQASNKPPQYSAELARLMADYYLRSGKKDENGKDGGTWLRMARDKAAAIPDAEERLAALREIMRMQIEFQSLDDVNATLGSFKDDRNHRVEFVRDFAKPMIEAGKGDAFKTMIVTHVPAVTPAAKPAVEGEDPPKEEDYSDQIRCLAILGQEFLRAGNAAEASKIAKECAKNYRPQYDCPPQFIALLVQLGEKEPEGPKKGSKEFDAFDIALIAGKMEGQLRSGKVEEAGNLLKDLQGRNRLAFLEACLLYAEGRPGKERPTGEFATADPALEPISAARNILTTFGDPKETTSQRRRLAEICFKAGFHETVQVLMEQKGFLADAAQDRIRLALLQRELEEATAALDANALLGRFTPETFGHTAACGRIARHNARFDAKAASSWAGALPTDDSKAFAGLGVSIGMHVKK